MSRLLRTTAFTLSAILLSACSASTATQNPETAMDAYQWKNRLVFVFTPTDDALPALEKRLKAAADAIDDRDILWFLLAPGDRRSNAPEFTESFAAHLRETYRQKPDAKTEVALVGKDGGVKYRDDTLDLDEIFRRIDAMPMRQAEMQAD